MPDSNFNTWIACTRDDLKIGTYAKVVETHTHDGEIIATVTIEGTASRIDHNYVWFGPVVSTKVERTEVQTQWYRQPKLPPQVAGTVIKVYDKNWLTDRAATYIADYEGSRQLTGEYRFTDRDRGKVPEDFLDSAEVIFDPNGVL